MITTTRALVVACWSGPRRCMDPRAVDDRAIYLKLQTHSLENVPHSLDAIYFVDSAVPAPTPYEYYNYFHFKLPGNIEPLTRPNIGLSYGAFSDAYETFPDHDYYFFLEDDYIFTEPNWDSKMIEIMEKAEKDDKVETPPGRSVGCVTALIQGGPTHEHPPHGAISTCVFRGACLHQIFDKRGRLPHADTADYLDSEIKGQVALFDAIQSDTSYRMIDFQNHYRVPYYNADSQTEWFYPYNLQHLFLPSVEIEHAS